MADSLSDRRRRKHRLACHVALMARDHDVLIADNFCKRSIQMPTPGTALERHFLERAGQRLLPG